MDSSAGEYVRLT